MLRRLFAGLLAALLCSGTALAASYTFRSDTYAWESTTNTLSWLGGCTDFPGDDDRATISFSGGFNFRFAGTNYNAVRVLSNGVLQFGADTGFFRNFTNTNLPAGNATARFGCTATATARVMMPYWTDLDPSGGAASVTWQQKGTAPNRYVVVSWNDVFEYGTSTPYTFQAILYENGEFKYQYANANATGANATIGVQVSGSDYTLYSFDAGYRSAGTAIRWGPPDTTPARVAEYLFEETSYSGAVGEVVDSSGANHPGVRVGSAASHASGQVCRGFDVPANTSTASSALDTALNLPAGIGATGSVSFWYRANAAWASGPDAQLFDASMAAGKSFHLVRRSGGTLRFAVTDSGGTTLVVDSPAQGVAAGTWVHVAATWQLTSVPGASALRLYINGSAVAAQLGSSSGSLDQGLGTLFVGDSRNNITSNNASLNSADGRFDELRIYNYALSTLQVAADRDSTRLCGPHHMELRHASGSTLTCNPSSVTVAACADAACAVPYLGGVAGTLTAGAGATVNWPAGAGFSIAAGASQVSMALHATTAGSTLLGISGLNAPTQAATQCNFGSPACTLSASDSGFVFDVPHHVAETAQTVNIAAVKANDAGTACVPAFAGVSRSIGFSCSYQNPTSGTRAVRVGGAALNASNNATAACDSGGRAVSLAFNASGVASFGLQYADVGRIQLAARYSGSGSEAGLDMAGSDVFVAAPAAFAFSAISAGPLRAGSAFAATVTAQNAAGAATPGFGRESPAESAALAFSRAQPTGAAASNGAFSGSLGAFSNGAATASTLAWSEVGRIDLQASLASGNYLGSGLTASGSTGTAGAVGRFIPHHFDVTATPACGSFSYAGQPWAATVTARNAAGGITTNYHGGSGTTPTLAQATTLSAAGSVAAGSFSGHTLAASAFATGVASASPAYAFSDKLTAPQTLLLRATDADATSSSGHAEPSMPLRSGRLRLADAVGSEKAALALPVWAEYWGGASWVANGADSCTSLPASAVAQSNRRDGRGQASSAWASTASAIGLAGGSGVLLLAAPAPTATGSVDIALNLGSGSADQSCLASHPASTGAGLPWLRSRLGACAATADRDPAARASFGIYTPETRRTVHVRDLF